MTYGHLYLTDILIIITSKDESFVSVREEFVRPLGSRHTGGTRTCAISSYAYIV